MNIKIEEISHGHGLSFKKGLSDGVLVDANFENALPNGHDKSYKNGFEIGLTIKEEIKNKVKK